MTNEANPTLGKIEDIFKTLVWDNITNAALTALFAANPGLAIWPVGPIIRVVVGMFMNNFYGALRLVVDMGAITLVNDLHKAAFDKAALQLKVIAHDKGIDSDEYKKARDDAKAALAKYVSFSG